MHNTIDYEVRAQINRLSGHEIVTQQLTQCKYMVTRVLAEVLIYSITPIILYAPFTYLY